MAIQAESRLEILQVYKLLQCVRDENKEQITKLCDLGIPMLLNYQEPNEGDCALHLACETNNEMMVRFLLSLGAYPNVQDLKGRTPIMKAAQYGHDKTVEILAKSGADMKIRDNDGKERHKRCLEIVLAHGANVKNAAEDGSSVLLMACENAVENEKLCLMLLEKDADVHAVKKTNNRTALHVACENNCAPVVKALLLKGADANVLDKKRHSALHFACQRGCFEAVQSLIANGADPNAVDVDGNNAMHYAAEGGFGLICRFLSQRGCDPKLKNKDFFTPRLLAKEKSHKDAGKELRKAEKLFTKYSKPGMKNPNDPAAVAFYDWACDHQAQLRELMMQRLAPPEVPSEEDSEYVDKKSLKGNFVKRDAFDDIMTQLKAPIDDELRKKIHESHDRNRKNILEVEEFLSGKKYIGKTYLLTSFEKKKKKGKKGKKKGGKKGKKGKKGKIPMPICTSAEGPRRGDGGPPHAYIEKQVQWTDTSRFNRDNPPRHPLEDDSAWYIPAPERQFMNITEAAKAGDLNSLKRAFKNGTPVDTRDKYFKTPLMAASAEGNIEMVTYLLDKGASVEAQDNFKWTALHHACHSGQLDVVSKLAYAGSDLNAVTWNGATPLMRAIESCKVEVVKFLLECGVNVVHQNKKDVAREWADAGIYWMVKDKMDAAPKPKKKDNKAGKKGPPKPSIPKPLILSPQEEQQRPSPTPPPSSTPAHHPGATEVVRPQTIASQKNKEDHPKVTFQIFDPGMQEDSPRPGTILHAANKLASGALTKPDEDVTFSPRKTWSEQATTEDLLREKEDKRQRYGFEVDFEDFEKPLKKNITRKVDQLKAEAS